MSRDRMSPASFSAAAPEVQGGEITVSPIPTRSTRLLGPAAVWFLGNRGESGERGDLVIRGRRCWRWRAMSGSIGHRVEVGLPKRLCVAPWRQRGVARLTVGDLLGDVEEPVVVGCRRL